MTRNTLLSLVGSALLLPSSAFACGGFFCDNVQPVDQAGERILFAIDEDKGEIEVHVQITYEGPAEDFGWILPVPTEPGPIRTSVDSVFGQLGQATFPLFQTTTETVGNCINPPRIAFPTAANDSADFDEDAGGDGVTIGQQLQVGPFETTTLTAETAADLTEWLAENSYDLPEGALDNIEPYVAAGSWFVALKLAKDADDGDLVPIRIRYPGTDPVIPLQLTAVAATPDMRLQPFVLGSGRAVPENYLHVKINEFAIDWFQAGNNYNDVVTLAADEAGGQAFSTDYSGPTSELAGLLWSEDRYRISEVARVRDGVDLTDGVFSAGLPVDAGTIPFLRDALPKPASLANIDDAEFYQCTSCWLSRGEVEVDGPALATALQDGWVDVLKDVQALIDGATTLTRLTSSISADEMTLDPMFVINPDMANQPRTRTATIFVDCKGTRSFNGAPRRLVLADGREMPLPSQDEQFDGTFTDWATWTGALGLIGADSIETTGRTGQPTEVKSNRDKIDQALGLVGTSQKGCGCDSAAPVSGIAWMAGLLLLARRRR